jgi:hypothetical protein
MSQKGEGGFMKRCIFVTAFLFACQLYGQGERGAIGGSVTDASGLAVPGATIVAIHLETNIETKAVTTDTGVYRIPYLPFQDLRQAPSIT